MNVRDVVRHLGDLDRMSDWRRASLSKVAIDPLEDRVRSRYTFGDLGYSLQP